MSSIHISIWTKSEEELIAMLSRNDRESSYLLYETKKGTIAYFYFHGIYGKDSLRASDLTIRKLSLEAVFRRVRDVSMYMNLKFIRELVIEKHTSPLLRLVK